MSHEGYPSTAEDEPTPRIRLQEGVDFLDQSELHEKVVQELITRGYDPRLILLCGHNQDDNSGQPRMLTYALPATETAVAVTYGSRSPYDEAIGTASASQIPTITAYDGLQLRPSMDYAGQYETVDGRPIDAAALMHVELSLQ